MEFRDIVPECNRSADSGWGKLREGDWGDVKGEVLCEWSLKGRIRFGSKRSWRTSNGLSQSGVREVPDVPRRLRACPGFNLSGQAGGETDR